MQFRLSHIVSLLLLATTFVYWKVPQQEFVAWDDNILVYNNPYFNPVTAGNVTYFWRHAHEQLYMPLTYSAWAALADAARLPTPREVIGVGNVDLNPRPFHIASLVLHLLNVLLIFVILRKLMEKDWPSAAGALLFAIHPVQVESVAWISELKGVLSGFFCLLAIWQYLNFASEIPAKMSLEKRPSWRQCLQYVVAFLCFILALLCKPSAVALPLIVLAIGCCMIERPGRRIIASLLPWLAVALLWSVLTRRAQPFGDSAMQPLWWRPFIAGDALAFYMCKLIWPIQLGIDYGRTPAWVMSQPSVYVIWLVPAALAGFIWSRRKERPWLLAAGAISLAAVLPVLGLVPFNFQQYSTVADRYLYLAMLGPAIILATTLNHAQIERKTVVGLCLLLFLGLGLRSAQQTLTWSNSIELYEHALSVNPRSWVAHRNCAEALQEQGRSGDAIGHLNEALRIYPRYALARTSMAGILARRGQLDEARAQLEEALRLEPDDEVKAEAHNNLGTIFTLSGKTEEALRHYHETLRIRPNDVIAHYSLGQILLKQGKNEKGVAHLREAARLAPDNSDIQTALAQAQQMFNKRIKE
jgi:tetratricopeptide (TPR) repeat protein